MQNIKHFLICSLAIVLISILLASLLVLSYSYASPSLVNNCQAGLATLEAEGHYPHYFLRNVPPQYKDASQGNNLADSAILQRTGLVTDQALYAAMDMQNSAHFWHGYILLLRPLLSLMSYESLRLVLMLAFSLLCGISILQLYQHFGTLLAFCFALSIMILQGFLIPTSPFYFIPFAIALTAMNTLLYFASKQGIGTFTLLLSFSSIGLLSCFLDTFSLPLLSLGLPLLFLLTLEGKQGHGKQSLHRAFYAGLAWFLGYGLHWLCKWLFATAIVNYDVLQGIKTKIVSHLAQTGLALEAIGDNFGNISHFIGMGYLLLCGLLLVPALLRRKKGTGQIALVLLGITLLPYLCYALLGRHSLQNAWFTFRLQLISLVGLPLLAYTLVGFEMDRLCPWKRRKEKA